jgi:hypothetical protein
VSVSLLVRLGAGVAAGVLLAGVSDAAQPEVRLALTVEAPASLAPVAARIRTTDARPLAAALARAGLGLPLEIRLVLIDENDAAARGTPPWIVGMAYGDRDIAIFPERIGSYPYDSLESVVWHEVAHLALSVRAGGRPLPRWFHEGVAMSIDKGWGVGSQVQLLLAAGDNPGLADLERLFSSETRPETARAYLLAAALMADLQQRYGAALPGAIAARVARGSAFEAAFAEETGVGPDEAAARAWRFYGRWTRWIPIVASASSLWFGILALACVAFVVTLRRRRRRRRQWDEEEWAASQTVH